MNKKKYHLEKAITKNNSNCNECTYKDNCPYKDKSECLEYNNGALMKSDIRFEDDF